MKEKPIYKLVDGKGRVLIPKSLRDAAKMEYGDIVRLGLIEGKVTIRKVDVVEAGDQSPEAGGNADFFSDLILCTLGVQPIFFKYRSHIGNIQLFRSIHYQFTSNTIVQFV